MAVSSLGIGSNMDMNSLLTQIMAAERQPLTRLQQKETSIQSKVSALGTVKSALSTFQTAVNKLSSTSKFIGTTATVGNTDVASATTATTAVPGSYSLEVTQLAQAQKLATAGQVDKATEFSTGTLTFDFGTVDSSAGSFDSATGKYTDATFTSSGSGVKTVVIDSSNNTLTGIRDAINKADIGVKASIINDGSATPYRLVLTSENSGQAHSMKISVSDAGTLQDLLAHDPADNIGQALSETVTAQNAQFELDGISATKENNTVTDMIQGVTLNLLTTNIGSPTTIKVERDSTKITESINEFVSSHNALTSKMKELTAYNATTKKASVLTGDSTMRSIQSQISNLLNTPLASGSNTYTLLSDIGISRGSDGTLSVDNTKLEAAIDKDFSSIGALFAAVGTPTNSQVAFKSSTSATVAGTYALNVSTLATKGTLTGSAGPGLTIDTSNDTLDVELNGVTATITLASGVYASEAALAAQVQSQINGNSSFENAGASVSATFESGAIVLTSTRYGSASTINITGGNGLANLMGSPTAATGVDTAGTINGVDATGFGQLLTGANGDNSEGLKLQITGTGTGDLGTVTFVRGFASQLDTMLKSMLDSEGLLETRTQGLNDSLDRLTAQEQRLNDRLDIVEKRYRQQFTALDKMMNSMTNTSSFLTRQLANL